MRCSRRCLELIGCTGACLSYCPQQVLKVNGTPVNNLKDLVAAVAGSSGQYITFDLEYNQV